MAPTNGTANECSGVAGCTSPPSTFAIPADPNVTAAGVTPIAGNFAIFNGTITAVSTPSLVSGSYASDSQTNITVSLTAGAANSGSTTNLVLAWGGHIATRGDWSQGSACVNISGSPFHMALVSFSGGGGGSQDRGLTASAVIFPATIQIAKAAIPTSNTSFPFAVAPALPTSTGTVSSFSLVNNGSTSNDITYTLNTASAFNVAYAFQESAVSGWSLIGLDCTVDPVSGSTADTSGNTATITPQQAGIINCAYTNSEPTVATPTLNPVAGTYTSIQNVTIGTATPGASIRYTTDGSTPSETAGTLYSGPVTVASTETLKAIAYESGMVDSGVASALYTIQSPSITSLSPTSGPVATSVTITGTNFGASQGTSTVTFNGTNAGTATSWSATSIVIPVPSGATTGNVVVTVGGLTSNGSLFTVTVPPSITTLSPTSGSVGTSVTIAGTNFGAMQGASTVTFNGTNAGTATSWSATSIVIPVPSGTTTGNVVVTVGGLASNGSAFTATVPPSITSLSPTSGPMGTSVTITGTSFGAAQGASTVTFNGTNAGTATSWSATSITVAVPSGATTGNVSVTVGGVASNGVPYAVSVVTPTFSPSPGTYSTAQSVTITTATPGASIRYTIDGSAPSATLGTLYSSPITVSETTTINAIAYKNGMADSTIATAAYTITPQVAPPTFNPAAGTYTSIQAVAITSATPGASIRYTTDGSTPTSSVGALYSGSVTVSANTTINAIAYKTGMTDSTVSTAIYTINLPPITVTLNETTATLYASQTKQFTATVANTTNTAVTWSATIGAIDTNGLYTAPPNIATQQAATITAVSQADPTKTASATITLMPPIAISVSPAFATLFGGEVQQFNATLTNATDNTVTWSATVGTIDAAGLYSAPASVTVEQTVTITASSVADPTKTATAKLTITPTATVFRHSRAITIDHTKVPNTDQINFPVMISGTYSYLANAAAGGQAYDPNGYDITFTSDAAGTVPLDREIESYNPVTGSITAWVRVPALSHTCDTTIYLFYGNPSVRTEQSTPMGVWDSNFVAVYHFGNSSALGTKDSTANGNHCVNHGAVLTAPLFGAGGGAASFNGTSSYMDCGNGSSLQLTGTATIDTWVRNLVNGRVASKLDPGTPSNGYELLVGPFAFNTSYYMQIANAGGVSSVGGGGDMWTNNIRHLVGVYRPGSIQVYRDGAPNGSGGGPASIGIASGNLTLGASPGGTTNFFGGTIDEVRISNAARSADWVATEFRNLSSPATFFSIAGDGVTTVSVCPAMITLLSGQTQQFTAIATNPNGAVTWSNPSGLGTLSTSGLYTAPVSVSSTQIVTITATSQADPAKSGSAAVTLPPVAISAVSPASATLYQGQTRQFTATVTSAPSGAVLWTLAPNVGGISSAGLYTAPASIETQQVVTVTAASQSDPSKTSTAMVTLMPPVTVTVSPATASMLNGGTQQFAVAVGNTDNTAVTWSITPAGTGSIDASGLYRAPITAVFGPVTIKATSVFDTTKTGSASLVISPPTAGSYGYRRPIVIDHAKVPNTDQTNFPVLISGTYPYLATLPNGGKVESPSGYDIIFTSDCAGLQKLDHEIESYDPVTGALSMWVRLPLVSRSVDTIFYLNYGSATVTTSQENRAGVWDGSFQAVLHLGDSRDSTTNGYTGAGASTGSAGKIGSAQSFDGVSQSIAYSQSPNPSGAISLV